MVATICVFFMTFSITFDTQACFFFFRNNSVASIFIFFVLECLWNGLRQSRSRLRFVTGGTLHRYKHIYCDIFFEFACLPHNCTTHYTVGTCHFHGPLSIQYQDSLTL